MNLLSVILTSISDTLILYVQVSVLNLFSSERFIRSRLVTAMFVSTLFKFIFELFFGFLPVAVAIILLLINEFKSFFLIWYIKRRFVLSDALIAIIIQEFCTVICSVIYTSLPEQISSIKSTSSMVRITVVVTITILAVIVNHKNHNVVAENISNVIPNRILVFVFFSLFIESGIIQALGVKKQNMIEPMRFIKIMFFVFTVLNAAIIVRLITSVVFQKYYGELNQILKRQVDSQLNHYKKLEDLNSEIREFRHDFNNHIKCLESMLTVGNYSDAQKYLGKITSMMPSGEFLFRTGNYIADAILTEVQENNKKARIEFKGLIPQGIDNSDLCVILSNAMSNAVEACNELPENSTVTVYGNYQQGVFVLIVKNPTANNGYSETLPKTTKQDKKLHGFGLTNIKRVVKKYDGTMSTLLKDNTFTLSLTMAVKQHILIS